MTTKKIRTHAVCGVSIRKDGYPLRCGRSPEHVRSKNAERRKHYDPDTEDTWTT